MSQSSDTFDEQEAPTRPNPQPRTGYGYHTRALDETDIDDIPDEEWEIILFTPQDHQNDRNLRYRGQRQLDSHTVNVWYCGDCEGFFAQSVEGC